jgi:hypothetical protein
MRRILGAAVAALLAFPALAQAHRLPRPQAALYGALAVYDRGEDLCRLTEGCDLASFPRIAWRRDCPRLTLHRVDCVATFRLVDVEGPEGDRACRAFVRVRLLGPGMLAPRARVDAVGCL